MKVNDENRFSERSGFSMKVVTTVLLKVAEMVPAACGNRMSEPPEGFFRENRLAPRNAIVIVTHCQTCMYCHPCYPLRVCS